MAAQQGAKGNPASKRMSNPRLKERRASSWRRTEAAKAAGTHRTVKNRARNEVLAAIAAENFGLGQREVRRIRSGKNTNHGLTGGAGCAAPDRLTTERRSNDRHQAVHREGVPGDL